MQNLSLGWECLVAQGQDLRGLLSDPPLVAPGVYDCITARLAEDAGYSAVLVSGAAVAASLLGVPDIGLMTMTEVLQQTRNIVSSVGIPVLADCDTGYGNVLGVTRTVREFERAGVAGLFIEDQTSPKRCGHFDGKGLIPPAEMAGKLRAAVAARTRDDLMLVARTDAMAAEGVSGVISRGQLYAEAGADMLFIEAPETIGDLEGIPQALRGLGVPLMVNLVEGGKTPLVPVAQLAAMGYSLVTFSGSLQKTAIAAMRDLLRTLRTTGSVGTVYPGRMVSLDERSELLGLSAWQVLEAELIDRDG